MNNPLLDSGLLHIPELLVSLAVSFINNRYEVTGGLASAEQLNFTVSFRHAFSAVALVVNCTFSGLSKVQQTFKNSSILK